MAKKKSTNVGMFQYVADAPSNPTLLDFPPDEFGLCRELRKAMTRMAGRLCGDQKKLRVAERNLSLLIGHMYSRYAEQGGKLPVTPAAPATEPTADAEQPTEVK